MLFLRCAFIGRAVSTARRLLEVLPVVHRQLGIVPDELVINLLSEFVRVLEDRHLRTQTFDKAVEVLRTRCIQGLLNH